MLIVFAINFGSQNSTDGCTAKIVVNDKIGATFLVNRHQCNSTAYTCFITLKFKGVMVQLLAVFAMNSGGKKLKC